MPRRADIDTAFRKAIRRDHRNRRTVTTRDFLESLREYNWEWTPDQANHYIRSLLCFGDRTAEEGTEYRTYELFSPYAGY